MSNAAQVVSIALAEVGYREKATNASLDLAKANAGSGNWTKYARDLYAAGYYNGNKNGYAWCDVFVDWCFFKAFGKTEGQMVECQTGTLGAACPYSAGYYKALGRYDRSPRVGDQVFFQQGGELVHTGVLVGVSGSTITCVEGNASDMVKQTSYSLSNSYVAGFGHPKYDESGAVTPTPAPAPAPEPEQATIVTIQLPVLRQGMDNMAAIKAIQRICYARGCLDNAGRQIKVDGSFGPATKQAVIKLQRQLWPNNSSKWDGVVGAETWAAALTKLW